MIAMMMMLVTERVWLKNDNPKWGFSGGRRAVAFPPTSTLVAAPVMTSLATESFVILVWCCRGLLVAAIPTVLAGVVLVDRLPAFRSYRFASCPPSCSSCPKNVAAFRRPWFWRRCQSVPDLSILICTN